MPPICDYDIYIFDCDGVIFDSNQLKIKAMKNSMDLLGFPEAQVSLCVDYFSNNFGKSRFHHVEQFISAFLKINEKEKKQYSDKILNEYSKQCKVLYLSAELSPRFIEFVSALKGRLYVASGSEQQELRDVFRKRQLDQYFEGVYGSPTPKCSLVEEILSKNESAKAVMIGDAESDFLAAKNNNIDFIFYEKFSTAREKMLMLGRKFKFKIVRDYGELLDEIRS
ncbi:MAG: HAD family hydrolase [Candidatus Reddybacter sp.]